MSAWTIAAAAVLLVAAGVGLLVAGRALAAWLAPAIGALALWALFGDLDPLWPFVVVAASVAALAIVFGIPRIRRVVITRRLQPVVARALPRISDTERAALDAGTVGWEGQLFAGAPDLRRLLGEPIPALREREREFLAGPVERLCALLDEWSIDRAGDLPPQVWDFLKRERFFGLVIPERYGGLGFSAAGHAAVISRLASRSVTATVTVMVPSSLGPGELLVHYGTEAQRQRYLPALALGEEIPCFALTEPGAGSDAAAIESVGVVTRGPWQGEEIVGVRLRWDKRYITLAPVATVIGLAFRLRDPERLLGGEVERGITCALIPAHLPGVEIGERHDPLGVPFQNGPTRGRGVFVPLDAILGGPERAGQGWRMVMESLAAGRAISLPSLAVGGAQLCARTVSAHARVREQFGLPIGRFEGVEEAVARIAGYTYLIGATRRLVVGAVDRGERPAVLSAIAKAYSTELLRRVAADALDVRAGAAICQGPRNILATVHASVPIGITVEGANILTRSLIIFGQGALRCHPFARAELQAIADDDLVALDRALFGHAAHVARSAARALVMALSGGRPARLPGDAPLRPELRRLARASAIFALTADAAMLSLGAELRRRERISGRLADALAWMVMASSVVKQFIDDGARAHDLPIARWALEEALAQVQAALVGVHDNLPNRPLAWALRALSFPLGARWRTPSDPLSSAAARAVMDDPEACGALTRDIYLPPAGEPGLGLLEAALARIDATAPFAARVRDAIRAGTIEAEPALDRLQRAERAGVLTALERRLLDEAEVARREAMAVDSFPVRAQAAQRQTRSG